MDLGNAGVIAAFASLVVALLSGGFTVHQGRRTRATQVEIESMKAERERVAKAEERQLAAREQLERIRRPLSDIAQDVHHRLANIRRSGFLAYVHIDDARRREVAVMSTTLRLAQYWGAVEFLYGNVDRLRLEEDQKTAGVANLIVQIGRTFGDDGYDGRRLMMWREEQRAVGELMLDRCDEGRLRLLGFASFAEKYDDRFAPWFSSFSADLSRSDASHSVRFAKLEALFAELTSSLAARIGHEMPAEAQ